ncbi:MAG: serine protease [Hyphomicrobiales bacterium]|nr:MAG: serine protease [Hyphomicrobiales bacterium]
MATIAQPTVMSLLLNLRSGGQKMGSGTGFIAMAPKGPVLVTNRHNVTGLHQETGATLHSGGLVPDEIEIVHNRANKLGEWVTRVEKLHTTSNAPAWFEHPTHGAKMDCVALPLSKLNEVQLYPYDMSSNAGPPIAFGVADIVSVVGFPFGMTGGGACAIWATGFVASEPVVDFNNLPLMLIDCRSRPGQSGSAVIAYRGGGTVALEDGSTAIYGGPVFRFLGIYSGRINAQSDLGFVWKREAVAEVVAAVK